MGSFWQVPSPLSCNCTNKKGSALCDNPLMKPSRQQAQWAAYFSQYRICVFPIMPTELISLRKFICACCMCQHDLCDISCHGTMQWQRKSQWASSIFTAFHGLMSSTLKNHWGATENRNFKNLMVQAIKAAKTSDTNLHEQQGTHSKQQVVGEHTK